MTRTNRILNRVLLAIAGVVLLGAGAGAIVLIAQPAARRSWTTALDDLVARLAARGSETPHASGMDAADAAWLVIVACAVLATALVLWFVSTRGRGGTATALREAGDPVGTVSIDVGVVRSLIAAELSEDPDVVSARVDAFLARGTVAGRLLLVARAGASPARLAESVRAVVERADRLLGVELPLVVEIVPGLRSRAPGRVS